MNFRIDLTERKKEKQKKVDSKLGKASTFCITGTIPLFSRGEAIQAVSNRRVMDYHTTVTMSTDVLITGIDAGVTKLQAARDKGVIIRSYKEFPELFGGK